MKTWRGTTWRQRIIVLSCMLGFFFGTFSMWGPMVICFLVGLLAATWLLGRRSEVDAPKRRVYPKATCLPTEPMARATLRMANDRAERWRKRCEDARAEVRRLTRALEELEEQRNGP